MFASVGRVFCALCWTVLLFCAGHFYTLVFIAKFWSVTRKGGRPGHAQIKALGTRFDWCKSLFLQSECSKNAQIAYKFLKKFSLVWNPNFLHERAKDEKIGGSECSKIHRFAYTFSQFSWGNSANPLVGGINPSCSYPTTAFVRLWGADVAP